MVVRTEPSTVRNPFSFATFPHPRPALISNCLSGEATLVGPDRPTGKEELHDIKSQSPLSSRALAVRERDMAQA